MSDKASSDLDIFDGLAAKKSRPAGPASVPPPPGSRVPPPSMTRQKTLLGLSAPGPATSRPPGAPPPPPPSLRPGTAPPPPAPSKATPPPPPPVATPPGLGSPLPPPPPAPIAALPSPPPPPPPKKATDEETTPAPVVGAKSNGTPKPGVDIDWDDEDEATTVFDRTQEDALRSLLQSPPPPPPAAGVPAPTRPPAPLPAAGAPPAARVAPLTPRPSAPPPPSLPRVPLSPPPRTATMSSMPAPVPAHVPTFTQPPTISARLPSPMPSEPSPFERTGRKPIVYAAAVAIAVGLVVLVVALLPKQGSLVITVAGPGNKAVGDVEVYVDEQKRCTTSPCQVKELSAAPHMVRVSAPGYQSTAPQAVKVISGDEAVLNLSLTRGSGGSGLNVRSEGHGLKLIVDGKEVGPLPQELPDLAPGDHQIKIDGGDRYEPFEKSVSVSADQVTTLEPKLKVKKGLATIKPGLNADGAHVVLVSGSERRPVPSLPLAVDIPIEKPYSIVATKHGFQDFEQKLEFQDGEAERTFVIDMQPPLAPEPPAGRSVAPAAPSPPSAPHRSEPRVPAAIAATAPAPKAPAGNGTLSLNSIPVSNVILDGRPLGPTPKTNVSVAPGNHTVIFVHPEKGRKAKSVTITAGKPSTVVVRF